MTDERRPTKKYKRRENKKYPYKQNRPIFKDGKKVYKEKEEG